MIFRVSNGFNAGISFYDTLQSCPYDHSAPDRHFRFSKGKAEVGYWMIFRVFNRFIAGNSFCETLHSCPQENSIPDRHLTF
jgi:hypothetical protein